MRILAIIICGAVGLCLLALAGCVAPKAVEQTIQPVGDAVVAKVEAVVEAVLLKHIENIQTSQSGGGWFHFGSISLGSGIAVVGLLGLLGLNRFLLYKRNKGRQHGEDQRD